MDQRRIVDAILANRQSHALAAAVHVGLFDALDDGPQTAGELAELLGLAPRPTSCLLRVLQAMGLLAANDTRFALAPDVSQFLVRGKPGSLAGLVDMEIEHGLTVTNVIESVKKNSASIYGSEDLWERHDKDVGPAQVFTAAMHSISEAAAAALAPVLNLRGQRRLLDIGGGSGAVALAIARFWEHLECVILDRPAACAMAARYVAQANLQDRVTVRELDMFRDPFPEGFDVILFSQVLHDWPSQDGLRLLQKAHTALPSDGRVIVHEKLVSDDHTTPLSNVLVHLDMLVWTQGQQLSGQEVLGMIDEAGFLAGEITPTVGYWSVIAARKQ